MKRCVMVTACLLAAMAQYGHGMMMQLPQGGYSHASPSFDVMYNTLKRSVKIVPIDKSITPEKNEIFFGQICFYKKGDNHGYFVLTAQGKVQFSLLDEIKAGSSQRWLENFKRKVADDFLYTVELVAGDQPPKRRNALLRW